MIHGLVAAKLAAFRINFPARVAQKSGSEIFTFRSRWCYCAKIIMASAGVLAFVPFVSHLPAVLVPARDRLRQARHRAAAAGAAGAVVAEAADHERSAFFVFGGAPHPSLRHQEAP